MVRSLSVENDALRKVNISSHPLRENEKSGNMFDPWICDMSVVL